MIGYHTHMARTATSSEVAAALDVSPATIQRYARDGRIPFAETPGGHRRFDVEEVRAALAPNIRAAGMRPRATAVVLTALSAEFDAVLEHLPNPRVRRMPYGTRYYEAAWPGDHIDWSIVVAEVGEGNIGAATEATRAIDTLNPDILLFVGVAGSLKPEIQHGHVVVASKVYRYHSGKAADQFLARPMTFPTWHGLDQLVRHVRSTAWTDRKPKPLVELKPIAAGEVVVTSKDSETFDLLARFCNDAVAVDMESAGLYEAAHRADGAAVLAVRGISDMLDDKAASRDETWQPAASRNAAEFAFALLRSAEAEDLRLQPASPSYPDELSELLGRVPPPAASAWRASSAPAPEKLDLLRRMVDLDPAVDRATESALDAALALGDPDLLIAVGELAVAHLRNTLASEAFEAAVAVDAQPHQRWLARAALAAGAGGDGEGADRLLALARAVSDPDPSETKFVDVIAAALSEDASRVDEATREYHASDPLVALMRMRALAVSGRLAEAVELGESLLAEQPGRSLTGGLALETARLLLEQSRSGDPSRQPTSATRKARELALDVRNLRRQWKGPSSEAAVIAAEAAAAEGDFADALRIAAAPPLGEAVEPETASSDLALIGAHAALAMGDPGNAALLAQGIDDDCDRLLLEADCAKATGSTSKEIVAILGRAEALANTELQMFRVLMGLAEEGISDLTRLEELGQLAPDKAAVVRSRLALHAGDRDGAVRELRAHDTPLAMGFLTECYVGAGRADEAVETLRRSAERFGRTQDLAHAVRLLAQSGQYEEALAEATRAMLQLSPGTITHQELRRTCIELSSRLGDWAAMVNHARAALSEGSTDSDVRWALVGALYNQRDLPAALSAFRSGQLAARDEQEAQLAIALLREEADGERSVRDVLELAERFEASEVVVAAAFSSVMEMTTQLDLKPETAARIQEMTGTYFDRFPDSSLITRIDASDIDNLVSYLRAQFSSESDRLESLVNDALLCRVPFGMPAVQRGRSVAGSLITLAMGCVPVGPANPSVGDVERLAARESLDGRVIADTHTLFVLGHTGRGPADLLSHFTRVLVPQATLDDVVDAVSSLRMRSTGSLGWNAKEDRPTLVEVSAETAESWAREAEALLETVKRCETTWPRSRTANDEANAILAPLSLAKEQRLPLWSDDPVIRQVARSEGLQSFGTIALLEALAERTQITSEQLDLALLSMLRACLVDLPLRPDLVLAAEVEDDPPTNAPLLALTRPSAWNMPEQVVDIFKQAVKLAAVSNRERLEPLAMAAGVGAARSVLPHLREGALATLILSGYISADSDPTVLPALLRGARSAAEGAELSDPLPQLASMLRDSLVDDDVPPDVSAQAFTFVVGHLDDRDRNIALREFLRAQ